MKTIIALFALLALSISSAQSAIPKEFSEMATRWTQTINSGKLNDWLELHAEDVQYQDNNWWQGKSRKEMRSWGEALVAAKGQFTLSQLAMRSNELTFNYAYRDSGFSTTGKGVIALEKGKIQKLVLSK
jgi:hypothetical protein